MRNFTFIAGIVCLFAGAAGCLSDDHFAAARHGRFRLTRLFYVATWRPWGVLCQGFSRRAQTGVLLQLLRPHVADLSLMMWAGAMVVGFALIFLRWAARFNAAQAVGFDRTCT